MCCSRSQEEKMAIVLVTGVGAAATAVGTRAGSTGRCVSRELGTQGLESLGAQEPQGQQLRDIQAWLVSSEIRFCSQ